MSKKEVGIVLNYLELKERKNSRNIELIQSVGIDNRLEVGDGVREGEESHLDRPRALL